MGNEMFWHFLFRFLSVSAFTILVHAQDQSGFISIDCGLPANSSYTDSTTSLNYISDAAFIDVGISKNIAPGFNTNTNTIDRQQLYVRSFPEGERNCYNLALTKDTKYLIRATFLYANYDGLNKLPAFDLHLGPNKWVTVQILNASTPVNREIIHIPKLNYIYVCLVNTGSGTPFISALELRPLNNNTYVYVTQSEEVALAKFTRWDLGSVTNKTVRYPDDVYDRLWWPDHFSEQTDLSTSQTIDAETHNDFQPPSIVMRTASTPTNASKAMDFFIDTQDSTLQIYAYMHFAEIIKLEPNQSRQFNISLNGKVWYGPVVPDYLYTTTVYSKLAIAGGKYDFSLFKIGGSTLPPLLNAIELYYVVELLQSETNQADVDAIAKIKSTYGITRNWQGDPCAPQDYVWQGLNCSYDSSASPIIISLNLSSSELTGQIISDIANLKSLVSLDLSNNNLSGSVPDFLSQLPSLKALNLSGNKLSGTIPVNLFERSQNGSLLLSISGNPELCPSSDSCKKKKKSIVVPIVASIAAFLVLVTAVAVIFCYFTGRSQVDKDIKSKDNYELQEPLESKKCQFSYSEVLKITNNFEKVLGKGGFGTVYHGSLDDGTQVAVKMLSPSSIQGYKEFQAEVKLLLRVHHRNLTTLVGYCNEETNKGLIYEYMAYGNLEDYLSDTNSNTLNWATRLRIALEAAQGLEYLHNGCKLQIVHRDVKTTNILLNEKFQAKLADFGLSRIFPADGGTHVSTIVAGTPGYLDPEYYITNWLTDKSDVHSFGVVLLEIITGRPVIAKTRDKTHISHWVSSILKNGDIENIVDPRLNGDFEVNSLWKVVELAMACVSTISAKRPTMNQVVMELNDCLNTEMAKRREGYNASQSKNSIELVTVNVHTELSPLAR